MELRSYAPYIELTNIYLDNRFDDIPEDEAPLLSHKKAQIIRRLMKSEQNLRDAIADHKLSPNKTKEQIIKDIRGLDFKKSVEDLQEDGILSGAGKKRKSKKLRKSRKSKKSKKLRKSKKIRKSRKLRKSRTLSKIN